MNVAIVKYNAGNIYSVVNALRRMGIEPLLTDDAEQLKKADRVLFPGQGHAAEAMAYLKARRLDEVIRDLKQPVFGICVGQQLLCKHSEEGDADCIGIFDAEVKRFQPKNHEDKVPCMGWNKLSLPQPLQKEGRVDPLMEGLLSPLPLEGTGCPPSLWRGRGRQLLTFTSYIATMFLFAKRPLLRQTTFFPTLRLCIRTTSIPANSIQRRVEKLVSKS